MTTSNQNESASNLRGVTGNTPQIVTNNVRTQPHPPRLRRMMITCHNELMLYKIRKQNRS